MSQYFLEKKRYPDPDILTQWILTVTMEALLASRGGHNSRGYSQNWMLIARGGFTVLRIKHTYIPIEISARSEV